MFLDQLLVREWASMEVANQLTHINSALCWCDPIVEVDENEREIVIHKEVTWN